MVQGKHWFPPCSVFLGAAAAVWHQFICYIFREIFKIEPFFNSTDNFSDLLRYLLTLLTFSCFYLSMPVFLWSQPASKAGHKGPLPANRGELCAPAATTSEQTCHTLLPLHWKQHLQAPIIKCQPVVLRALGKHKYFPGEYQWSSARFAVFLGPTPWESFLLLNSSAWLRGFSGQPPVLFLLLEDVTATEVWSKLHWMPSSNGGRGWVIFHKSGPVCLSAFSF